MRTAPVRARTTAGRMLKMQRPAATEGGNPRTSPRTPPVATGHHAHAGRDARIDEPRSSAPPPRHAVSKDPAPTAADFLRAERAVSFHAENLAIRFRLHASEWTRAEATDNLEARAALLRAGRELINEAERLNNNTPHHG